MTADEAQAAARNAAARTRDLDYYCERWTAPPAWLLARADLWGAWAYVQAGPPGRRVDTETYSVWSDDHRIVLEIRA